MNRTTITLTLRTSITLIPTDRPPSFEGMTTVAVRQKGAHYYTLRYDADDRLWAEDDAHNWYRVRLFASDHDRSTSDL